MLYLLFLVSQTVFPTELCNLLFAVSQHSCILKPEERQKPQEPYMWWTFKSVTLCDAVSKACCNDRDPCSPENAPAESRYYARPQLCAEIFKLFDLIIL